MMARNVCQIPKEGKGRPSIFFSFVVGFLEAKTTYTVKVKAEITVPEFSECA